MQQYPYSELRCKSNFSFLSGASHPEELIHQAHALGYGALAITDRDGVYGLPKTYRAQKHHPHLKSVKLISGCELTLEDRPALTLLATSEQS